MSLNVRKPDMVKAFEAHQHVNIKYIVPRAHALLALPLHKTDSFRHRRHALKISEVQSQTKPCQK